jgi:hypothetical protein
MFSKWVKASAAAIIGAFGFASLVEAAPQELTGLDGSGNVISSGWTWDVSAGQESLVNLVFIRMEGDNFFFEKDAEMTNINTPIVISFNKISQDAANLVINDEAVLNNTGVDWGGFRMELSSGSTGGVPNFAFTTHDGSPGIGDFAIDPFTAFMFYNQNSGLLVNGGVVHAGETWFPGSQSTTGLAIVNTGNVDQSFTLKEIAIPIPLPAAAWTGLTTLAGIGLISARKRVRGILA